MPVNRQILEFRKAYDKANPLSEIGKAGVAVGAATLAARPDSAEAAPSLDPLIVAKIANAIPVIPAISAVRGNLKHHKEREFSPQKFLGEFAPNRFMREAMAEFQAGRRDIDEARQPHEALLGMTQAGFAPIIAAGRVGFGDPVAEVIRALGGAEQAQDMGRLGGEFAGAMLVPGIGIPRLATKSSISADIARKFALEFK